MVFIDLIVLIFAALFFLKGYSKGILYTVLRFLGLILSILIATHFSNVIADKLFNAEHSAFIKMLPVLSYSTTLFLSLFLINFGLKFILKPINRSILSPINKVSGGLVYSLFVLVIAGSILWFLQSMDVLNQQSLEGSYVSQYLIPIMPMIFNVIGSAIPVFKESYNELNTYFQQLASDL